MTGANLANAAVGFVSDNGNTILLAVLGFLAVEVRRDVRDTRDKVLILWRAHNARLNNVLSRRQGDDS